MYCNKCGAELLEGNRFCTACGAPVSDGARQESPQEPRQEARPEPQRPVYYVTQNVTRGGFNVLAALCAVAAVIGVFLDFVDVGFAGASYLNILGTGLDLGLETQYVVLLLLTPLFILLSLVTAFLPRKISGLFSLLGAASLALLAFGGGDWKMIGDMPWGIGFYLMAGGLVLGFVCQLFYFPRR